MTEDNTAELLEVGLTRPQITAIERLELRPGEVLVIHTNREDLRQDAADQIRRIVESKLPKGSRALVVPKGTELSIVSPAVADAYEAEQEPGVIERLANGEVVEVPDFGPVDYRGRGA
jgi:hypothetical protein